MLPDRVSNPGPVTYESGALPIALRGPAEKKELIKQLQTLYFDRDMSAGQQNVTPMGMTAKPRRCREK